MVRGSPPSLLLNISGSGRVEKAKRQCLRLTPGVRHMRGRFQRMTLSLVEPSDQDTAEWEAPDAATSPVKRPKLEDAAQRINGSAGQHVQARDGSCKKQQGGSV